MKRKLQVFLTGFLALICLHNDTYAQLTLQLTNLTERIDFDSTKADVNLGSYVANGISSAPSLGELDADAWQIIGMSSGAFNFGDSSGASTDYARGTTTLGVSTGGIYSFTSNADAKMLGIQPGGSDMTPGTITLKVLNTTGTQLDSIKISYTFYSYSDQTRSQTLEPSFSTDNVNYTALTSLNDTSQTALNTVALWVAKQKDTTVAVTVPNGGNFYLRWTTDDLPGTSGSRDEIGIDNIELTGLTSGAPLSIATINVNNPNCFGATDGDATVITNGGTAPLTYLWNNGVTTANNPNLGAGTYYITVSDAIGDNAIDSVTLVEPDSIDISLFASDIACFGDSSGVITSNVIGGSMPYTYLWSTGDTATSIDSLPKGAYALTITDANGCTKSETDSVLEIDQIMISFTDTATVCNQANGSVTATFIGGAGTYSYVWSNGVNGTADSTNIDSLAAGTYTITVTDAFLCQVVDSVVIMNSGGLTSSITSTNTTTATSADGTIDLTVTGGTTPYTFTWNDGAITEDRMNLTAGTYVVTATDAVGCSVVDSATITSPVVVPPAADLVITEINYNGPESGTDTSEFIEFTNLGTTTVNLDGYLFAEGVDYTFTANDSITPNQYFVIAFDSAGFRNRYGFNADAVWTTGGLSNGGEDIIIVDNFNRGIDTVDFDDAAPWPVNVGTSGPDGNGSSIELTNLSSDNNVGSNWVSSTLIVSGQVINGSQVFGSPGNPYTVGINTEELSVNEINIYPNPTSGMITLSIDKTNFNERFQLIDMTGKVIRDELLNQPKTTLDLRSYSNGIYFLKLGDTTKKVILNR